MDESPNNKAAAIRESLNPDVYSFFMAHLLAGKVAATFTTVGKFVSRAEESLSLLMNHYAQT